MDQGSDSFWSFSVEYLENGQGGRPCSGGLLSGVRVDYREVLKPDEFALFVKLRLLRQEIAKDEAVPVYMVFTNEQLARSSAWRGR